MSMKAVAACLIVFFCGAAPAPAQMVSLEFQNGRVRLVAENAPVGQILAEWSRLGGTKIVNGERIPGAPVTLQLLDISERQALDVVLRGAAGYVVAGRDLAAARASVFESILILPTTRPPTAAAASQAPPPPQAPTVAFDDVDDDNVPPRPGQPLPAGAQPVIRLPQGRVVVDEQQAPPEEAPPPQNMPTTPVRANPFGVTGGSTRPGTISPVSPPRNPNQPPTPDR
jgi:hypothetical protein